MKKVNVIGIGAITAMGNSVWDIWENLDKRYDNNKRKFGKLEYVSWLPSAKRRRINRYSDMALFSAASAINESSSQLEGVDPARVGTIYSTGYGPMTSNLDFASKVYKGDPDLCSPTIFSNTVSNACVGQICMNLNCKGVSTILMGSNNIGYSQMLLSKNAAEYILSGAVEEYSEELYHCLNSTIRTKDIAFCESAVTFLLARTDIPVDDYYCTLVDFQECDLGNYPIFNQIEEQRVIDNMKQAISQVAGEYKIDIVLSAAGSGFELYEREAINAVLPGTPCISNIKKVFGETLGVAFNVNALVACLILKYNQIPFALKTNEVDCKDIHRILVAGYNVSGNYIVYLFERM